MTRAFAVLAGLALCAGVSEAGLLDSARQLAAETTGTTPEAAKALHSSIDGGATRPALFVDMPGAPDPAASGPAQASPEPAPVETRPNPAKPTDQPKEAVSEASWVVPTLAGAALFVAGLLAKGPILGPALVLIGLGTLIYGLVRGAKANCQPVNGQQLCEQK